MTTAPAALGAVSSILVIMFWRRRPARVHRVGEAEEAHLEVRSSGVEIPSGLLHILPGRRLSVEYRLTCTLSLGLSPLIQTALSKKAQTKRRPREELAMKAV
jgi:hypothetical protein